MKEKWFCMQKSQILTTFLLVMLLSCMPGQTVCHAGEATGDYVTIPYLSEQENPTRFDLMRFVGNECSVLLQASTAINIKNETEQEVKLGTDFISITADSKGVITRLRIDPDDRSFCVMGICPGMGTSDIHYLLWENDYNEISIQTDDNWRVFVNEETETFLAYKPHFAYSETVYFGLQGYMPFSVSGVSSKEEVSADEGDSAQKQESHYIDSDTAYNAVYKYVDETIGADTIYQYHGYIVMDEETQEEYVIHVRSYTSAHGYYYVNKNSGDVYESWISPITNEPEPRTFVFSINR